MQDKTLTQLRAEEQQATLQVVKPNTPVNSQKNNYGGRVISMNELTDILSRPIEKKDQATQQEIPESIKQRAEIEEINFKPVDDENDIADYESEDHSTSEPNNPEDFKETASFIVVVVSILWPMFFYGIDQRFIKSGQGFSYYELNEKNKKELIEKSKPVFAEWTNRPQTPKNQLLTVVATIAVAQIGGAIINKQMNIINTKENDQETKTA